MTAPASEACRTFEAFSMMDANAPARRTAAGRRRIWTFPLSLLVHAAILGGVIALPSPPRPAPLPQIELVGAPPPPAAPPQAQPQPPPQPPAARTEPPPPAPAVHRTAGPRLSPKPRPAPVLSSSGPAATEAAAAPLAEPGPDRDVAAADAKSAREPAERISPPAGPPPDYVGLIRAQLERAKRYPAAARREGREGVVAVRFVLDRSGALLSCRLESGSGDSDLDEEALAMAARAAPFPPFPDTLERRRLDLVVPIRFSLKGR